MKTALPIAIVAMMSLGLAGRASAHCEMPCGIYGDPLRFQMLTENVDTVDKAVKEIQALSAKKDKTAEDYNQLTRWVNTKEAHATKMQETVSEYFLHQRIKPAPATDKKAYGKYIAQLTAAHALLIDAMHAKQTVDPGVVAKLRKDLATFQAAYMGR